MSTIYKRVMLKMSGEMLGGKKGNGLHSHAVEPLAKEIASVHHHGIEIAVVIGGGNIFRGTLAKNFGMDQASADNMGMLSTCINGLALQAVLENQFNIHTRVMTAIHMPELAEPYIRRKAIKHLNNKRVVIFAGGTGNPMFTTDTAASLRALEVNCEILLKGTKVDGVYDCDPINNPKAKKFSTITYLDALAKNVGVMDATAITMCMENNLPIKVFKVDHEGSVLAAITDKNYGTLVY